MKCEDLQLNLSLYSDDVLSDDERAATDAHLAQCPVCRYKLAQFQTMRNDLRVLARPAISHDLVNSIKNSVAAELRAPRSEPRRTVFSREFAEWLQMRVMPYAVGAAASLVLGFTLLYSLLSAANEGGEIVRNNSLPNSTVMLAADSNSRGDASPNAQMTASEYAATRLAFSAESPSVNPQGALVALTKSLVRGSMKDEEVVVVADVFGDGLAQITEVVEPSRDRRAVYELEKALKTDSAYAPFVPANLDRRSDAVRVVFKIQTVDVKTHLQSQSQ